MNAVVHKEQDHCDHLFQLVNCEEQTRKSRFYEYLHPLFS